MKITLSVYGDAVLQSELGGRRRTLELPDGATIDDLNKLLGGNLWSIGSFAVNGRVVEPGTQLHDGDDVHFLAAVTGGASALCA